MSLLGKLFKYSCTVTDKWRDRGQKIPDEVDVIRDIPYLPRGDKYNLLDVSRPKSLNGALPVIVNIHGGGFVYGTKRVYQYYAASLALRGFAVINFNYHLAPKTRFPMQLCEINSVFDWLCNNAAEYNFDLDNLFITGDSAGAQMASHYAAIATNTDYAQHFPFNVPDKFSLRAIALNCGIYDFPDRTKKLKGEHAKVGLDPSPFIRDYIGRDTAKFDKMLHMSENMTERFPPAYIATGEYDFLKAYSLPLHEHLRQRGVKTIYKSYGTKETKRVAHIFHVNMRLPEATACNDDECRFFIENMQLRTNIDI